MNIKLKIPVVCFFGAILSFLLIPDHVTAQGVPVCMAKPASVPNKAGVVAIEISGADVNMFADRGFKRQDCAAFQDRTRKFQRQMCQIALLKDPQIESEFFAHYGIRPSEGCPNSQSK